MLSDNSLSSDSPQCTNSASPHQRLIQPLSPPSKNKIIVNSSRENQILCNRRTKKSLTLNQDPKQVGKQRLRVNGKRIRIDAKASSNEKNLSVPVSIESGETNNTVSNTVYKRKIDSMQVSVNNSYIKTAGNSPLNANQPKKPSQPEVFLKQNNQYKNIYRPARRLSLLEVENVTKRKNFQGFEANSTFKDSSELIIEGDKKHFLNEFLFKRNQNREIMNKLYSCDDESWIWSPEDFSSIRVD